MANNTCQMIKHRRKPSNWNLEMHLTSYLRHCVEFYHSSSERFCICAKWWDQPQHCTIECSIYLSKWSWPRIVHINHRNMPQKSERLVYYTVQKVKLLSVFSSLSFAKIKQLLDSKSAAIVVGLIAPILKCFRQVIQQSESTARLSW